MNNQKKEKREIDTTANEVYSFWKKSFVFVKETRIKTWKSLAIITFFAGVSATLMFAVSVDIQTTSEAANGNLASLSLSPTVTSTNVNENFDLNIIVRRYEKLYDSVVRGY